MESDEKKVTLDELPDEGSSSSPEVTITPRPKSKTIPDPRKEILKPLDDKTRIQVMEQKWHFDKKEFLIGWLIYICCIGALQILARSPEIIQEVNRFLRETAGEGSTIINILLSPGLLVLLTPFLFNLRRDSLVFLDVTFDGLSTVFEINPNVGEHQRIFVKWTDIAKVQKTKSGGRDILQLTSANGPLAQVIWDLSVNEKKGILHLIKGLVASGHPLRQFLEKDLA